MIILIAIFYSIVLLLVVQSTFYRSGTLAFTGSSNFIIAIICFPIFLISTTHGTPCLTRLRRRMFSEQITTWICKQKYDSVWSNMVSNSRTLIITWSNIKWRINNKQKSITKSHIKGRNLIFQISSNMIHFHITIQFAF